MQEMRGECFATLCAASMWAGGAELADSRFAFLIIDTEITARKVIDLKAL